MLDLVVFINYPCERAKNGLMHLEISCERKPSVSLIAKALLGFLFPVRPMHFPSAVAAKDFIVDLQVRVGNARDKYYDASGLIQALETVLESMEVDVLDEVTLP